MKRILLFLFLSLATVMMAGAQAGKTADELLKEAAVNAGKEGKNVFVMFTASWCGWCHKMKDSMEDEDVKKYFDESFITLYFVVDEFGGKDPETPGAVAFRTKYGGDDQGIPYWIIFNKDGIRIGDSMKPDGPGALTRTNTGCPADEAEVDYFIKVLKQTTRLKEDQLEKINKRFRKNRG